jgi:hypothetical protein
MSSRGDLFRQEALEFRTRGETTSGNVIRLGAPWVRWSFRLLLVLVAAGITVAFFARTDETSTGPAVIHGRDRTFSALLPAAVAPELRSARLVRIDVDLPGTRSLRVRVTRARSVAPRTALGGLPSPTQPAILLSGRITGARAGNGLSGRRILHGRVTVVLGSKRVGEVVTRHFGLMLGGSGGGE